MFICWCCLVNIQVERDKDVHMMVLFGEYTSRERQRCSYDILFGEYTSRKRQRCSYDVTVWSMDK